MTPTSKKLERGDFVLANGPYLGEVIDITTSDFGYESYLVKYLQETPLEGIDEDWIPSFEIHLFMKRSEMARDVREALQKETEELRAPSPEFSEKEIYESTRDAVMEMWRVGIGKYIEGTMIPKYKVDFGMGFDPAQEDV
jgi:hypothetical protein